MRENESIDVTVQTSAALILFEIKSDLDPKTVIRLALGQILEYAFHPSRNHTLPLKLVIVGRRALSAAEKTYMDRLRNHFNLPIDYRTVSI